MRISDWSSDVCSSDLSSSVTEVRCFAAAAITILPTCGLPVKKMWSKGRSSSACETEASPSQTATRFAGKVSSTICRMTDDVAGVSSRSEEHTSELQSLMRSSYAVFCLKNKKQTTNTEQL